MRYGLPLLILALMAGPVLAVQDAQPTIAAPRPAAAAAAAKPPNVLLILADDMGAADLGCFGSDLYKTPNLDRLAAQGAKFTRAYAAGPVCSPTRAGLMTGKAPARLHLTDWLKGHDKPFAQLKVPDWTMALPAAEVSLGRVLKDRGYATAWLGKWHLGGEAKAFGFDAGHQDWVQNRKDVPNDPKGVFTLNAEAQAFIDASAGKPFFVALSHYSVHLPIRFDPAVRDKYQKAVEQTKPRQTNAGYAAMTEALDDSVGQMLAWLDKKGLADDTLVIFTSDNGGLAGPTNNFPLRSGKGSLYEGGVRVPMIVRWPGHVTPGSTNDTRFCSLDYLPSLATLTGATLPPGEIDGKDLSAALAGGPAVDRGTLYWHYPHYHTARPCGSILAGDWKLIESFETGKVELYNLAKDPSEATDLSAEEAEWAKTMLADLVAWRARVGAQMPTPNPSHDPKKENQTKKAGGKADEGE